MARLTVEQKWWIDPRRSYLMGIVDEPSNVDGAMIQTWRIAQEYWGDGGLIPWRVFSKLKYFEQIVQADLVELRGNPSAVHLSSSTIHETPKTPQEISNTFVYVRGSKDFFSWIFEVREKRKLGGKISAKRPRDNRGRLLKNSSKSPANVQDPSSSPPAQSNTVQVSGSDSGSGLGSNAVIPENNNNAIGIISDSSAALNDASYQVVALRQIGNAIDQAFGKPRPQRFEKTLPKILVTFGNVQSFVDWLTTTINAKNCPSPDDDDEGFTKYFSKSLANVLEGKP